MARYTFGGDIHDAVPAVDAQGFLKVAPNITVRFYAAATGGTPLTDYLVDVDGNGSFETAASSITVRATGYLPDFQGPDGLDVLYYDPDPNDTDVRRVRYVARDIARPDVAPASPTVAGIVKTGNDADIDAGTATDKVPTIAGLERRVDAHANAPDAHPTITSAVETLQEQMSTRPARNAETLKLVTEDLPASVAPTEGNMPLYGPGGTLQVGVATADEHAPRLAQVRDLILRNQTVGGDVRSLLYLPTTPVASGSTTFSDSLVIPDVVVADAATDQEFELEYDIIFRATAAAGIKVQHKTGTAAPTNVETNPRAETDVSGWYSSGNSTLTRVTNAGTPDGSNATAFLLTANAGVAAGSTITAWSAWKSLSGVTAASVRAQLRRTTATARNGRADVQFGDDTATDAQQSAGVLSPATNGASVALNNSTTYVPSALENVTTFPTGATKWRTRVVMLNVGAAEAMAFGAVQLEPSATLPTYGSTGGSGTNALRFIGRWGPSSVRGTTDPVRSPAVAYAPTSHAGLGINTDAHLYGSFRCKVIGAGLTNQRMELQFAQIAADNVNTTKVMAVRMTAARVA